MLWDRMEKEPSKWFDRFEVYRGLGPSRSIDAAYKIVTGNAGRAGHAWRNIARAWNWQDRAESWDEEGWSDNAEKLNARRRESHERRVRILDKLREETFKALIAASLGEISQEEARANLSPLRTMMENVLRLERVEIGAPVEDEIETTLDVPEEWDELITELYADDEEEEDADAGE